MSIKTYSLKKHGSTKLSEHFTVREFACSDGSDEIRIDTKLVNYLEQIRTHFGVPIHITSGYRSPSHNAKVGGAKNSYHMKGMAADVVAKGVDPKRISQYAELIGIRGIGCYENKKFTHIDTRTSKTLWIYNIYGKNRYVTTFSSCPYTEPKIVLQCGAKGGGTKWIQWHLFECGYNIVIDGIFGNTTKARVIAFQKYNGLTPDGIVGPITREKLKEKSI